MIICAACKYENITLCGPRHWDTAMRSQYREVIKHIPSSKFEQGFIDERGQFYHRRAALAHAVKCRQDIDFKRNGSTTELYSEGLY